MKTKELNKISKFIFTTSDIAKVLSISNESANVSASRYAKNKDIIRLKRDCYILPEIFRNQKEEGMFKIANILQTPSYISLTTALSYYNITTQQQRGFIESIAIKRSKNITVFGKEFIFTKINPKLYKGFELKDSFFIASPEKAIADAVYLASFGKYSIDFDAIDFNKIRKPDVERYLETTGKKTLLFWKNICKIYEI